MVSNVAATTEMRPVNFYSHGIVKNTSNRLLVRANICCYSAVDFASAEDPCGLRETSEKVYLNINC